MIQYAYKAKKRIFKMDIKKAYILQIIGLISVAFMAFYLSSKNYFLNFPDGGPAVTPYAKLFEDVLFPLFFGANGLFFVSFILTFFFTNKVKQIFIFYFLFVLFFLILDYLAQRAINVWI